jgi:phosphoribosyl 1,2-cyclic phosphodiesterase
LLIECGVNFDKIKEAIGFNLSKIVGCLVTHEHGDHSKSMNKVIGAGINVYATNGTFNSLNIKSHRAKIISSGKEFKVGRFTVKPFDVQHDVEEPVGLLINHPETGNVLFLTDSYYCRHTFNEVGLHNIIIEANYSQDIVDKRVADGGLKFLRDRVLQSHMSLDTCKDMLKANDLRNVKNILLIHLSDGNSDEKRFKKEVEEATGKTVHVACAGMEIDFNKSPF